MSPTRRRIPSSGSDQRRMALVIDNYGGRAARRSIRNASLFAGDEDTEVTGDFPNNPERVAKLTIDFGPRTIIGRQCRPGPLRCRHRSVGLQRGCRLQGAAGLSQVLAGQVVPRWSLFPDREVDTLGHLETDQSGRLWCSAATAGRAPGRKRRQLLSARAASIMTVLFRRYQRWPRFGRGAEWRKDHETRISAGRHAWVVGRGGGRPIRHTRRRSSMSCPCGTSCTTPSSASWTCSREIYSPGQYKYDHIASFEDDVAHIFRGTALQEWISNLPKGAKQAHRAVGRIGAETNPAETILSGLAYIRNPNLSQQAMLGVH